MELKKLLLWIQLSLSWARVQSKLKVCLGSLSTLYFIKRRCLPKSTIKVQVVTVRFKRHKLNEPSDRYLNCSKQTKVCEWAFSVTCKTRMVLCQKVKNRQWSVSRIKTGLILVALGSMWTADQLPLQETQGLKPASWSQTWTLRLNTMTYSRPVNLQ